MLDGLDDIPWSTLRHAYGPANDTPVRLRELASPDPEVGDNALWELFGSIWHQGTVYEATAYAVPFLIELAQAPEGHHRAGIVELLAEIAQGTSYLDVHGDLSSFYDDRRDTPEFEAEKAQELAWVQRAHEAVGAGIDTYMDLLQDADAEMRTAAAHALAAFPEHAERILPALLAALTLESESETGGIMALGLGKLLIGHPNASGAVEQVLREASDPRRRLACAVALAKIAREQTSDAAVETLVEAFSQPEPRPYSEVPYRPVDALRALGAQRGVQALACALSITTDDEDAHQIANAMLNLAFGAHRADAEGTAWSRDRSGRLKIEYWGVKGEAAPVSARSLTTIQRASLRSLVASDPVWQVETNLFALFGLPIARDAVAALIL